MVNLLMILDPQTKNFQSPSSWILRITLGISIFIRGLDFVYTTNFGADTSASLAGNIIATSEIAAGVGIILGGFIFSDESNDLITRLSGTLVVLIMCAAFYFYVIHSEVILTFELFKNEKISLFALGIYFALRGNN